MSLLRFEHRTAPLAPRAVFFGRLAGAIAAALALIGVALAIGMIGYRLTENMAWLDAFLNAAMLLGGMGEVDPLHTDAGKLFAGIYALFCGLLIVVGSGIILAPILHRVLHALHLEDDATQK
jgi:ABC-type Na+ efflux pump permease subunit